MGLILFVDAVSEFVLAGSWVVTRMLSEAPYDRF